MKNVASYEIANVKVLNEFRSIVKKVIRTKLPKTCLSHINKLVELLESEPAFDKTKRNLLKLSFNEKVSLVSSVTSKKDESLKNRKQIEKGMRLN